MTVVDIHPSVALTSDLPEAVLEGFIAKFGFALAPSVVFRGLIGSRAYGFGDGDALADHHDYDYVFVFVPPFDAWCRIAQCEESLQLVDGALDITFHSIRRYLELLAKGTHQVAEATWSPEQSWYPAELFGRRRFITKQLVRSLIGTAGGLIEKARAQEVASPGTLLPPKKTARHALRLARMAHEVVNGADVLVLRPDADELKGLTIREATEEVAALKVIVARDLRSCQLPETVVGLDGILQGRPRGHRDLKPANLAAGRRSAPFAGVPFSGAVFGGGGPCRPRLPWPGGNRWWSW